MESVSGQLGNLATVISSTIIGIYDRLRFSCQKMLVYMRRRAHHANDKFNQPHTFSRPLKNYLVPMDCPISRKARILWPKNQEKKRKMKHLLHAVQFCTSTVVDRPSRGFKYSDCHSYMSRENPNACVYVKSSSSNPMTKKMLSMINKFNPSGNSQFIQNASYTSALQFKKAVASRFNHVSNHKNQHYGKKN